MVGVTVDAEADVGAQQVGPLAGLRVVDLSPNRVGAQTSQLFADFGADVIQVEPPGGVAIRHRAAFPFWCRGKRSIVADLFDDGDRDIVRGLIARADVLVETFDPGVLDDLALDDATLRADNPRLVHVSVTGFGREGPWSGVPGYEGTVLAKLGVFQTFRRMSAHDSPPFVTVPFAAFAASQIAIHGVLAALVERERSGAGQWVETNLVQAFTSLDTWAWFEHLIGAKWPGAFVRSTPYDSEGRPGSALTFMLLVALTKDGTWLQFASVAPRLFAAQMKALGLDWMFTDERWADLPLFGDDADRRQELWTSMLSAANDKLLSDWEAAFEEDSNVFAEQYRSGAAILEHPQLMHDGMVLDLDDGVAGRVRQPGPIVKAATSPAKLRAGAPALDQHRLEVLGELGEPHPSTTSLQGASVDPPADAPAVDAPPAGDLPLSGITVVELATLFAAPHGTTMLTDLGARVIKIEPLEGDRIRTIIPFPESGGAKVMQGKESICVDLTTTEGEALVARLAATADVVVQGYRAGAMARVGLDYQSIRAVNPDVIYVNAPGYGVDGPYGDKPAYAPSIGAATGLPLTNVGVTVGERAGLTMAEIQDGARRLSAAAALSNAQADGFAALGVTTAILFGVVARQRGAGGQELFSSMLNTGAHAMSAQAVTYPGAPKEPAPDPELRGLGALYRVYDAADGYVFLAAPSAADWDRLTAALAPYIDLAGDARFPDAGSRHVHCRALVGELGAVFASRSARAWEDELLGRGVGCVAVHTGTIEELLFDDTFGRASGYVVDVVHPTFDAHPRLAPYLRFSRSATQALPGVLAGSHTDRLLAGLGATPDQIADLRQRQVVR